MHPHCAIIPPHAAEKKENSSVHTMGVVLFYFFRIPCCSRCITEVVLLVGRRSMGRGAEPVGLDDFNMRCLFDYQRIGLDCREVSTVQNMRRRGARSDKCAGLARAWGCVVSVH
jgi:hypothetical protein